MENYVHVGEESTLNLLIEAINSIKDNAEEWVSRGDTESILNQVTSIEDRVIMLSIEVDISRHRLKLIKNIAEKN